MKTIQKLFVALLTILLVTSCAPVQEKGNDQMSAKSEAEFKVNPLAETAIMHPEYVKTSRIP